MGQLKGRSADCFLSSPTAKSCFQNKTFRLFSMLCLIVGEVNGKY